MRRKVKDKWYESSRLHSAPSFTRPDKELSADEEERLKAAQEEQENQDDEDGEQGSASGGKGGGPSVQDANDRDFDPTELQGLSIPIFRNALKKGLKIVDRLTKQSESYLRNFLPDQDLRARVKEVALSENGHPTLLLDKGEIVQYQLSKGKLDRVLTSPDLDPVQKVRYAMAGFIAAGESIDPAHVKFNGSAEFQARVKPIWTQEYNRIQQERKDLGLDATPSKDAKFRHTEKPKPSTVSRWVKEWKAVIKPQPQAQAASRLNIPRTAALHPREPQM